MSKTSNKPFKLPTWESCASKVRDGKVLTALEKFIHENELTLKSGHKWRRSLTQAIKEQRQQAIDELV